MSSWMIWVYLHTVRVISSRSILAAFMPNTSKDFPMSDDSKGEAMEASGMVLLELPRLGVDTLEQAAHFRTDSIFGKTGNH